MKKCSSEVHQYELTDPVDPKKCTFEAKLNSILNFMLITCYVQKISSSNSFTLENFKKIKPNLPKTNKSTEFI